MDTTRRKLFSGLGFSLRRARALGLSETAEYVSMAMVSASGPQVATFPVASKREVLCLSDLIPCHASASHRDTACQTNVDILTRTQFEVIMKDMQAMFLSTLEQIKKQLVEREGAIQALEQQICEQKIPSVTVATQEVSSCHPQSGGKTSSPDAEQEVKMEDARPRSGTTLFSANRQSGSLDALRQQHEVERRVHKERCREERKRKLDRPG